MDLEAAFRAGVTRARLADASAAAACAAVAFFLALAPVSDVDFFWHLNVGRYLAEHGALPQKNLWSFTAPDHPFEATAWLFDWCAYQLHAGFGAAGVQVAVALVLGAAFAVVFLTARRRGAPVLLALALTVVAAFASQSRFSQRPQAVTYFFLAVAALLVTLGGRWRWGLPLLVAVWSNFHAGCVFGAGLVGLVAIAEWVARWWGKPNEALAWSACAAACVVALTLNPSGAGEVRYALFHLGSVTNVVDLAEFQRPPLATHAVFWLLVALGALAVALRPHALPALVFLAFAVLAGRAMYVAPMFSLVTVPFTAAALAARLRPVLQGVVGLGLLPVSLFLAPEPARHFVDRVHLGVDPYRVPEAGAAAARSLGLNGRCFPSWDLGGFVEWALPDAPVYSDPRLLAYPPEVFAALAAADEAQPKFDALMDEYQVTWAFRSHRVLRMSGVGRFPAERWALLYWDEASLVFVRRDLLGARAEVRYFLPAVSPVDSFHGLQGEAREAWWAEVRAAAERSPRLAGAQVAVCLEQTRRGELAAAARACDAAVDALLDRERFHPLEGQRGRNEAALAIALLGRAGDAAAFDAAAERALSLSRQSPEVLTALGGMVLAKDKARALGYFARALAQRPDFAPALKGKEAAQR